MKRKQGKKLCRLSKYYLQILVLFQSGLISSLCLHEPYIHLYLVYIFIYTTGINNHKISITIYIHGNNSLEFYNFLSQV